MTSNYHRILLDFIIKIHFIELSSKFIEIHRISSDSIIKTHFIEMASNYYRNSSKFSIFVWATSLNFQKFLKIDLNLIFNVKSTKKHLETQL